MAEALKIAFADRAAATADPDFVTVPVERLVSAIYAAERGARIYTQAAPRLSRAGVRTGSAQHHPCDRGRADGHILARPTPSTACSAHASWCPDRHHAEQLHGPVRPASRPCAVDRAGQAHHHQPGTADRARDGKPLFALGLPGRLRIFGTAMQALINLIDHGMSLQESVEAPRMWTQGQGGEIEQASARAARAASAPATRSSPAACRRRDVRDPLPCGRADGGCGLLAGRWHAIGLSGG